jgi:hypothetical protein
MLAQKSVSLRGSAFSGKQVSTRVTNGSRVVMRAGNW